MESNSFFYIGLGFLSIILLIAVYVKTRNPRSFMLFTIMVGLGYFIEAFIYNFFHSYQYFPKIIHHDPFYDSNMGAIASNALALPVAATFIAALNKSWVWVFSFIFLFFGIEWLFLELHIYTHNWWKSWYTSIGLSVYFPLAKSVYKRLLHPLEGFFHTLFLLLMISPIAGTLHILPIMLFQSRYYHLGWFETFSQDTTAFGAIFYLCASIVYVVITKLPWKPVWLNVAISAICMESATFSLKKAGILHSQIWWDTWYYLVLSILMVPITASASKHLSKGPQKNSQPS